MSEQTPLLTRLSSPLAIPPVLSQPGVEKMSSPVTLSSPPVFPIPTFATARLDAQKKRMPQCIAHRGYKAAYPENTLASFKGAVKAGAHALETDVHITKDDVVVLSHDARLKRCYGVDKKILDCDWEEIKGLRTTGKQQEGMPRLQDLLEYLAQPGLEETWLLLDIKLDNDADKIMRLLGSTLAAAKTSPGGKDWKARVLLGIWAAKYLSLAQKYLPDFPITHIGFSVTYARHFFEIPNVGFNMLLPVLIAPGGKKFIRDAKEVYHRQILAWTVNEEDKMRWCIRRGLDGVITDDPSMYNKVVEKFDERQKEPMVPISIKGYLNAWRVWLWITMLAWWYRRMFLPVASRKLIEVGVGKQ